MSVWNGLITIISIISGRSLKRGISPERQRNCGFLSRRNRFRLPGGLNVSGIAPYKLKFDEYVVGSYMSYVKNDDYIAQAGYQRFILESLNPPGQPFGKSFLEMFVCSQNLVCPNPESGRFLCKKRVFEVLIIRCRTRFRYLVKRRICSIYNIRLYNKDHP